MEYPTTGFTPTQNITDLQKVKNIIAAINAHWQDCQVAYWDGDENAMTRGYAFECFNLKEIDAIIARSDERTSIKQWLSEQDKAANPDLYVEGLLVAEYGENYGGALTAKGGAK